MTSKSKLGPDPLAEVQRRHDNAEHMRSIQLADLLQEIERTRKAWQEAPHLFGDTSERLENYSNAVAEVVEGYDARTVREVIVQLHTFLEMIDLWCEGDDASLEDMAGNYSGMLQVLVNRMKILAIRAYSRGYAPRSSLSK